MTRRSLPRGILVPAALFLLLLGLAFRPPSPRAAGRAPGDMGIVVVDLSPEARRTAGVKSGALVIDVLPDGPADQKDIHEGDIITEYGNEPVRSAAELTGRIRRDGPGYLASVSILRDGSEHWLGLVTLAARPAPPATREEINAHFAQLEDELDALKARVDSLERARVIPRRPAIQH